MKDNGSYRVKQANHFSVSSVAPIFLNLFNILPGKVGKQLLLSSNVPSLHFGKKQVKLK